MFALLGEVEGEEGEMNEQEILKHWYDALCVITNCGEYESEDGCSVAKYTFEDFANSSIVMVGLEVFKQHAKLEGE